MPHAPPAPARDDTGHRLALGSLVAVALVLRLWGITFGLPYLYHFDEPNYLHMAYRFTFDDFHPIYGPLFGPMQLLVIAEHRIWELLHPLLRWLPLSPRLEATALSPIASYNLLARWTSALFGALSLLPIYELGRRAWNRRTGLLAAALLAVCLLHARSSHYGVPDATVAFFVALAAMFALRLTPGGRWRDHLLAGLFCGLAFSAKLLAWPVMLLPALVYLARPLEVEETATAGRLLRRLRRLLSGRLVIAYCVAAVAAIAAMPQVVLKWDEVLVFWQRAAKIGLAGGLGPFRLDDGGPLATYLYTLVWGTGWVMSAAILAGLVLPLVRQASWRARLLAVVTWLYIVFLFRPDNVFHSRYLVAITPLLVLFAAAAAVALVDRLPWPRRSARTSLAWLAAAALALGLQPLAATVRHDVLLTRPDTRTLARDWIEANVPEGRVMVIESSIFSPPLSSPQRPLPLSARSYEVVAREIFGLSSRGSLDSIGTVTADAYRQAGADYLVVNSFTWGFHMIDPELDRGMREFYASLDGAAERVATFAPTADGSPVPRIFTQSYGPANHLWAIERPGPEIRIYRLRDDP